MDGANNFYMKIPLFAIIKGKGKLNLKFTSLVVINDVYGNLERTLFWKYLNKHVSNTKKNEYGGTLFCNHLHKFTNFPEC